MNTVTAPKLGNEESKPRKSTVVEEKSKNVLDTAEYKKYVSPTLVAIQHRTTSILVTATHTIWTICQGETRTDLD